MSHFIGESQLIANLMPRTLSDMEVPMLMLFLNIVWMVAIQRCPMLALMTLACVGSVPMTIVTR